jgi:WD40 repeat protein/serine/threonine protein kinase
MERRPDDVKTIFAEAVEIAASRERAAYLDKACGADAALRAEVERLLEAHEQAGDFLEGPPVAANVTLDRSPRMDGPGTTIGRYELLELLGEGGMGLVYLAEQKEPVRRKVALKIIKPGMDSKQVIARFEAERQALAVLDHPNIAHVYDAGCTETGRPYFVMEHVKGLPITRYCDDNKLTIEQRLRLFEQVCEAVHHAHQKGIIHRDLKPSNILVSIHADQTVPKIIDFGIAKAIAAPLTDKTFATLQGQLLGTPEYMSPEQVDLATQDIDTRSDIYSLGVVLYELLAGVLPFESELFERAGLLEIQQTIREQEPASPSIRLTSLGEKAETIAASRGTQVVPLARRLHRELEWIPLKAMRKDRCRRYKSASEMAGDIRNYLNGNPLLAGPETAVYRVQKFVHKHAGSVATVALVATAIVLGLVVSTAMYFRAESMRAQTEQAKNAEQEQRRLAQDRAEDLRRTLYASSIQLADSKYRDGNITCMRSLLEACPEDLRGWEWNRLNYVADQAVMTFQAHSNVYTALFSHDGKRVIAGSDDGAIRIWDLASGQEIRTLRGHKDAVCSIAISPDDRHIVSGSWDKTIRVWEMESGRELTVMNQPGIFWGAFISIAYSPDGKLVASAVTSKNIRVWDGVTGAEVMTIASKGYINRVAFSPDGIRIISGDSLGNITSWEVAGGRESTIIKAYGDRVRGLAVTSDGSRLASVGGEKDGGVRVWDAKTGNLIMTPRGDDTRAFSVAFSPDGGVLASGGADNMIKLWLVETGKELMTLRGHEARVTTLAYSPDGSHLISGSDDGTVRLWDATIERTGANLRGQRGLAIRSLAFSPDGRRLLSANAYGETKLWDIDTGAEVMTLGRQGRVSVFSPDGKHIASGTAGGVIRILDADTGLEVASWRGNEQRIDSLAFNLDGSRLMATSRSLAEKWEQVRGMVKIWDSATGKEIMQLSVDKLIPMSVAFGPDSRRCLLGDLNGVLRLFDVTTGGEVMSLAGHTGCIDSVAFSPDGKRIVSGSYDGTVKVWDAETGSTLATLRGHGDLVISAAFSRDGRRIVSGSRDGTVKIWDATKGAELLTLQADSGVGAVAFSPDGKTIAGGTIDNTIFLWQSAEPMGGYESRRIGQMAQQMVDRLHAKYSLYRSVIDKLLADGTLHEPERSLAIQIANSRKWEDADKLGKEAWETANSPGRGTGAYRTAAEKAEKANGWEPNDPAILNTMAAAQYRLAAYEEALKTLAESSRILSGAGEEPDPINTAFTAMTLHRMGRINEAKFELGRLRELCKKEEYGSDMEVQALLAEAEGLIEGKKP